MNEIINNIKFQSDFLILQTETNLLWVTELKITFGYLVFVKKTKKTYGFFDDRYYSEIKEKNKEIDIRLINEFDEFMSKQKGVCSFEDVVPWNSINNLQKKFTNLQFKPINSYDLRLIKTKSEIKKLKKINQITAKVWDQVTKKIKSGMTEIEVAKMINYSFGEFGVNEYAWNPFIVSSDKRAFFIHTAPTNKKIKDYVLCDFGGKLDGFCADFTRVHFINPVPGVEKKWKLLKKLSWELIEMVRPGVKISELINHCDNFYKKEKLIQKHSLGHGIGLLVHESPLFFKDNNAILKPGMVFTIEPGFYEENWGGLRYENVILVTEDGFEVLTQS